MKTTIENLLKQKLAATKVEVIDDSALHQGHAEAAQSGGGHFTVIVVSDQFEGKTLIQRHRLIHDILKSHLKRDIHALAIRTYTNKEHSSQIN